MIARIIFEEDGKVIMEKVLNVSEDKYRDGKRMLQDIGGIYWDILHEVEDIINNGEPKF